jgi:hypothetical protein
MPTSTRSAPTDGPSTPTPTEESAAPAADPVGIDTIPAVSGAEVTVDVAWPATAIGRSDSEDVEPGEKVEWPTYAPAPDPSQSISLSELQLAHFYGGTVTEPPGLESLTRFEDLLRSHAIGGSTRKPEGFYGEKTADLVNVAYEEILGKPSNGVVGWDLLEALRSRYGAVIVP